MLFVPITMFVISLLLIFCTLIAKLIEPFVTAHNKAALKKAEAAEEARRAERERTRTQHQTETYNSSFTIYDRSRYSTVAKTYEGGERYIDGHKCCTDDDMQRWYAMKGYSEGIERRLNEIEILLENLNNSGGETLLTEWNNRYDEYRQLCIVHGLWNRIIGDRATFVPTESQKKMEDEKRRHIDDLFHAWQQRMSENNVLLDYLEHKPRKHAIKNEMIKELAGSDPEKRKQIIIIYRRLKKTEVIAEKENSEGKTETRIIQRRKKDSKPKRLPASTYDPALYSRVMKRDIYKVDYSVAAPQEIDRLSNTCFFVSRSSGVTYSTSLERCTCPAYCKGGVCKHMLALAMHLGYFNRSNPSIR